MALPLNGHIPQPLPLTGDQILLEAQVIGFRFNLMEPILDDFGNVQRNTVTRELEGVEPTGELDWAYNASIKGSGQINLTDLGQDVDWLNARVQPVATITTGQEGDEVQEYPLGVYIPSTPQENWNDLGRSWTIDLLDKASILDQDIMSDEAGNPITFSLEPGENVIEVVKTIIASVGEDSPAILPGNETVLNPMTWEIGTSKLEIVNDLLLSANYYSLWCDGYGQFQAVKYEDNPSPIYSILDPFSKTINSLMAPDWHRENDIYSVPNKFVAVSQGTEEEPALVAIATNTDPDSPYSYPRRGRWITETELDIEAVSQEALNDIAIRKLDIASSVSNMIEIRHSFLPQLRVNSTVRFSNPDAKISTLATITTLSIPFNPLELCTSRMRAIT